MVFPVFPEEDPVRQRTIGARSHGVVYVLVSISRSATVPRQLFHRLWFDLPYQEEWFATPSEDSTVVDHVDLVTPVDSSTIEIGPPLKGGPWAAFAGLSNDGDHRRIQTQVFGRSVFSQRYAIDYLLVNAEGRAVPVEGGGKKYLPGLRPGGHRGRRRGRLHRRGRGPGQHSRGDDAPGGVQPDDRSREPRHGGPWRRVATRRMRTSFREACRSGSASACGAAMSLAGWGTRAIRVHPTSTSSSPTTISRLAARGCRTSTTPSSWWASAPKADWVRAK